ncbi:MAG: AMP-binding protein, partial [Planctomycetia bacterium]|nr:AMP-binding protein [Planctomycetia bacterium]
MQVETFLENSARRLPDKTALVWGEERLTYGELDARCNRLSRALVAAGVERGDRVAIYLDNSIEAIVSVFAVLKAGAVFVMVNPTTKAEKLTWILNNCQAKALLTPTMKLAALDESWHQMPHLASVFFTGRATAAVSNGAKQFWNLDELSGPQAGSSTTPAKRAIDIDLAALIYTSGSTGNPKGVMLTHLNIVSAATSITTYLENREDDIILSVLPLSF